MIEGEWQPIATAPTHSMVFTDVGLVEYSILNRSWILCDIQGIALERKKFWFIPDVIKVKPTIF